MKLFNFDQFLSESVESGPYKDYNEEKPLEELELGDAVKYRGMSCRVVEKNEGAVTLKLLGGLKSAGKDIVHVNQAMYNQACYVAAKNEKAEAE